MSERARKQFSWQWTGLRYAGRLGWRYVVGFLRKAPEYTPRPGYCECCKMWAWLTLEPAARSTVQGWLCEECAIQEEREVEIALREVYGR